MANRPEAVAAFFGAALAGLVVVPFSTFSTAAELEQLVGAAGVSVLLLQAGMGSRDFAADVTALDRRELPFLLHAVVLGDAAGFTTWESFIAGGETVSPERVDAVVERVGPADLGLVIFSSGTTSTPKGILHNQQTPTLQFWTQARIFGRHEKTRMWTALPLFWTAGMNTAMGATLAAGGCWIMQEGFDAGQAIRLMEREAVTEPYTLPHQAAALTEHPDWAGADLSSLRSVFGKSVFSRHPSVTGDTSWNMPVGYGMSETCAFVVAHASDAPRERPKTSLGTVLPGAVVRIVDPETGAVLGIGDEGEIAVGGATLMEHYLGKTRAQCFDAAGYFRSGDVGFLDARGCLHWTGRRSEMIKTGGANVSPAELEVQLRAYPPVKLARVLGIPDPRLEQLVVLCVVLKEGAVATAAELQDFLRARVSSYKVPKRVLFFADGEIPMTASATKVKDAELRELVLARLHTNGES